MSQRHGCSAHLACTPMTDELVIRDRFAPYREETISGALLDAKRAVEELRGVLERTARVCRPTCPRSG